MYKNSSFLSKVSTLIVSPLIVSVIVSPVAFAKTVTYELDPAHCNIAFGVKHVGISTVRGNFKTFSGTIDYDPKKPEATKISVDIDPASVNTNNTKRDEHVSSPDFLDVKKFPKMSFVSKKAVSTGPTSMTVTGDLTIHGVTKSVDLTVTDLVGPGKNPMDKKDHVGAAASTKIVRQDFGLTWNGGGMKGLAGEAAIGNDVSIQIDIDAIKK